MPHQTCIRITQIESLFENFMEKNLPDPLPCLGTLTALHRYTFRKNPDRLDPEPPTNPRSPSGEQLRIFSGMFRSTATHTREIF